MSNYNINIEASRINLEHKISLKSIFSFLQQLLNLTDHLVDVGTRGELDVLLALDGDEGEETGGNLHQVPQVLQHVLSRDGARVGGDNLLGDDRGLEGRLPLTDEDAFYKPGNLWEPSQSSNFVFF